MEKRLEWTKARVEDKEQFDNVIFSNESSPNIERHSRQCYHKKGEPRKSKPKPKHPLKVYVWAGISKRGYKDSNVYWKAYCYQIYNDSGTVFFH